jgi:GalNAc-alpha-(1->4)-GalNAc-alpha-(1->3)-diNAcBac-PP-undecaprenol alpha-1,4-N-acetyl-D-galactosaminyltransferase
LGAGGAERVAVSLCNAWADKGHEVSIVATYNLKITSAYDIHSGVKVVYLADTVGVTVRGLIYAARLIALRRLLVRMRPETVVSFLPSVNIAALVATLGLAMPVVVSERTYPPAMPLGRSLETLRLAVYPLAAALVVQTDAARQWAACALPRLRTRVIANPAVVPLPCCEPVKLPAKLIACDQALVFACGRLSEEKRFDFLLRSFALVAARNARAVLAIAGEGPERSRLVALASELGIAEKVEFLGRIGNVGDWHERADIFVLTSRFEGMPNALLEAVCYGTPAVSTDCLTGPREIIVEGVNGTLISTNATPETAAVAIDWALSADLPALAQATAAARRRYHIETIAAQWISLFEELKR